MAARSRKDIDAGFDGIEVGSNLFCSWVQPVQQREIDFFCVFKLPPLLPYGSEPRLAILGVDPQGARVDLCRRR